MYALSSHEQPPSSIRRIVKSISSIPFIKEALEEDDFDYPLSDDILFDLEVVKRVAESKTLSPESKRAVHTWILRVKRRDRAERQRGKHASTHPSYHPLHLSIRCISSFQPPLSFRN